MKKISFEKFEPKKMQAFFLNKINGGLASPDETTSGGSVDLTNYCSPSGTVYASCTLSWSSDVSRAGVGIISYQNETIACAGPK